MKNKPEKTHVCPHCAEKFEYPAWLKRHIKRHHATAQTDRFQILGALAQKGPESSVEDMLGQAHAALNRRLVNLAEERASLNKQADQLNEKADRVVRRIREVEEEIRRLEAERQKAEAALNAIPSLPDLPQPQLPAQSPLAAESEMQEVPVERRRRRLNEKLGKVVVQQGVRVSVNDNPRFLRFRRMLELMFRGDPAWNRQMINSAYKAYVITSLKLYPANDPVRVKCGKGSKLSNTKVDIDWLASQLANRCPKYGQKPDEVAKAIADAERDAAALNRAWRDRCLEQRDKLRGHADEDA